MSSSITGPVSVWLSLRPYVLLLGGVALIYVTVVVLVGCSQRGFIFFPTHQAMATPLQPWREGGQIIGYARPLPHPRTVWLMTHGNAGQASQRAYALNRLSSADAFYVLEYPGYGQRMGSPSMASMNAAAVEAYELLRRQYPDTPVCALGESVGSGPASFLATLPRPPDKIVLMVPFDTLARVAAEHMPFLPVRLLLRDRWDNIEALKNYRGPVDIYGETDDRVIPIPHAKTLAASLPQAKFTALEGGHNDWSGNESVRIER